MIAKEYKNLSQLGHEVGIPQTPEKATLEKVPKPFSEYDYLVRMTCPEFTSLCPVTGQPDFAHIVIDYVPGEWLVESKSLKLFFQSFRNHGAFHEACTAMIGHRFLEAIEPKWIRISAYWFPRGGIPIDVFYQTGPAPEGVWIPPQDVQGYRGRG